MWTYLEIVVEVVVVEHTFVRIVVAAADTPGMLAVKTHRNFVFTNM